MAIRLPLLAFFLFPLVLGCGGQGSAKVTGSVTFSDGAPLAHAQVIFDSLQKGIRAETETNAEGEFILDVSPPQGESAAGDYSVIVIPPTPQPATEEDRAPAGPPLIDQRFSDYKTSGLKYTVSDDGPNEFQITVEKP